MNPEKGKNPILKRVLLVRGSTQPSDPIHGLEKELRHQEVDVLLAGETMNSSPASWMNLARLSQVIVFIRYENRDGRFIQSQLYRAKLFGRPIVRWWVGTDVLNSLESDQAISAARLIDRAVDLNIAVSPHLVKELQGIGISAKYVPSLSDLKTIEHGPTEHLPQGVLAYLPTERRAFYGEQVVIDAIIANPDLPFFIVGDQSHSLQHYPNVTSLGWLASLDEVWQEVGVLLRVTKHDGMPRMVLDALSRSRYVIYSEQFEGCWHARSAEEVLEYLRYFKNLSELNEDGPEITHNISASAGEIYTDSLSQLIPHPLAFSRLKVIFTSFMKIPSLLPNSLRFFSSAKSLKK